MIVYTGDAFSCAAVYRTEPMDFVFGNFKCCQAC